MDICNLPGSSWSNCILASQPRVLREALPDEPCRQSRVSLSHKPATPSSRTGARGLGQTIELRETTANALPTFVRDGDGGCLVPIPFALRSEKVPRCMARRVARYATLLEKKNWFRRVARDNTSFWFAPSRAKSTRTGGPSVFGDTNCLYP
jgi:hypothetical protein